MLAFISRGDEVLLIHRNKKNAFAYKKWNGIGGHIEKGEDPLTAIRREVKEETGFLIEKFDLNAVVFISQKIDVGIMLFVFSSNFDNDNIISSAEGEVKWIKMNEISLYDTVEDISYLLDVISNSKENNKVLILNYEYSDDGLNIQIMN